MPENTSPGLPAERRGSRRQLLGYLLGTSLVGWLGTVLYPVLRYLSPFEEAVNADERVRAWWTMR